MNYLAANTKVKAMRSKLLTVWDYEDLCTKPDTILGANFDLLEADFTKIVAYLGKPAREFVGKFYASMQYGFAPNAGLIPLRVARVDKSSHESLKRVLGTDTDLRNILYMYRLKKFHKIHGDAVFSHLSPSSYRLSTAEISHLAHARDIESFVQFVSGGCYGGFFRGLADFSRGEQILSSAVGLQFRKEYRHENLSVVCGYLFARYYEVKNLRAIMEGRRNGLSPQEIIALLHLYSNFPIHSRGICGAEAQNEKRFSKDADYQK